MIEQMPNIVYDLCNLILNAESDVLTIDTPIIEPLGIDIKSSFRNMSASMEHTLIIEYTPSSYTPIGLSDIIQYADYTVDEEVTNLEEIHTIPINAEFGFREVNGSGIALQLLDRYKEHPLVKDFCKYYNITYLGVSGKIVPIPFEINSTYHYESLATFGFRFMDSYSALIGYYNSMQIEHTLDETITGTDDFSLDIEDNV